MGMGKFRRRWIVNILRMQAIIVCAFFLICGITPLAVIADYVDDVSRTSLRTMDESMLESLRYAQQTIRFLAQSDGVSAQAAAYLDEAGSMQARQKAQVELRRHLLSAEYNNPEFEVVALIAPGTILTNLNVSGTIYNLDHSNQTLNEMFAHDAFRDYLEEQGYCSTSHRSTAGCSTPSARQWAWNRSCFWAKRACFAGSSCSATCGKNPDTARSSISPR